MGMIVKMLRSPLNCAEVNLCGIAVKYHSDGSR